MWNFKPESSSAPVNSAAWSPLQKDPVAVVPYRVVMAAVAITVVIIVAGLVFHQDVLRLMIGYWLGIVGNLLNFRGIVIGADNYLKRAQLGMKGSVMGGFIFRQLTAAGALYLAIRLGALPLLLCFLGLSMVKFVVQIDGALSFKNR